MVVGPAFVSLSAFMVVPWLVGEHAYLTVRVSVAGNSRKELPLRGETGEVGADWTDLSVFRPR